MKAKNIPIPECCPQIRQAMLHVGQHYSKQKHQLGKQFTAGIMDISTLLGQPGI